MAVTETHEDEDARRRVPRWLRVTGGVLLVLVGAGLALLLLGYVLVGRDLPDERALLTYEPPLPTHVRDINGLPVATFARERRVSLPYEEMPPQLIAAFVSAEDKTFFTHEGLDFPGIFQAAITNFQAMGSNKRPVGASTITQQVAKNLLLSGELSYVRKLKEAILAYRIEQTFTKPQILELYLNQIFLGRNAYGVQAASYAYFSKPVSDLNLPEIAYLAVLPKAPANYSPSSERGRARALERRNYVLAQMAANGYISAAQAAAASSSPLAFTLQRDARESKVGRWYVEDVRRELIRRYGETGKHGVYSGGLSVRTAMDPELQKLAETVLRESLARFEAGRAWRGPAARIEDMSGDWSAKLRALALPVGYDDWRAAVVLSNSSGSVELGFEDGSTGTLPPWGASTPRKGTATPASRLLARGDVIPVKKNGSDYVLRQIPEISGGIVVQDPHSGRVLAMAGGFDSRGSTFNRASQAMRQPGSAIKPFVYAAALDNGFTPASLVSDAPYCVSQGARLGTKCFRNFSRGYAGKQTMRWGLEQSRNLMTVRLANGAGMKNVVKLLADLGIGEYQPVLSIALGAGETTVLKLTNAYSMLANGGKRIEPVLIDLVQDRNGKAIYRADGRLCEGCNAPEWTGAAMPRPVDNRKQAMNGATAYQVVHMLEGVIERGTAVVLRSLDRPLFGKTGTTTGPTDVWFVGGTPDMVVGLYMGYDRPRSLGGYAQGGTVAAPVFKQFGQVAFKDQPKTPFAISPGVRMVRIDRRSGRRVYSAWPDAGPKPAVIWEAFKPESEPRQLARVEQRGFGAGGTVRSDADFLQSTGGIY